MPVIAAATTVGVGAVDFAATTPLLPVSENYFPSCNYLSTHQVLDVVHLFGSSPHLSLPLSLSMR